MHWIAFKQRSFSERGSCLIKLRMTEDVSLEGYPSCCCLVHFEKKSEFHWRPSINKPPLLHQGLGGEMLKVLSLSLSNFYLYVKLKWKYSSLQCPFAFILNVTKIWNESESTHHSSVIHFHFKHSLNSKWKWMYPLQFTFTNIWNGSSLKWYGRDSNR